MLLDSEKLGVFHLRLGPARNPFAPLLFDAVVGRVTGREKKDAQVEKGGVKLSLFTEDKTSPRKKSTETQLELNGRSAGHCQAAPEMRTETKAIPNNRTDLAIEERHRETSGLCVKTRGKAPRGNRPGPGVD